MNARFLLAIIGLSPVSGSGHAETAARGSQDNRLATAGAVFVENRGQWPPSVLYMARMGAIDVRVEQDAVWFQSFASGASDRMLAEGDSSSLVIGTEATILEPRSSGAWHVLRVSLEGATWTSSPVGERRSSGYWNFLGSPDAVQVPAYDLLRFEEVLPGVDWLLMADVDGHPRFDFELRPGISEEAIRLRVEGGKTSVETLGHLVARQETGEWGLSHLAAFEEVEGTWDERQATWRSLGDGLWGIQVERGSPDSRLYIDPSITFTSFLGGNLDEFAQDIDVDEVGVMTLTGTTISPTFPTTPGVFGIVPGGQARDVYVTRVGGEGTVPVWSTVIGGLDDSQEDFEPRVDVINSRVHLGFRTSPFQFFATPGAYVSATAPNSDVIALVRLSPDGSALEYSALLGSSDSDTLSGLFVTDAETLVAYGSCKVADLPVSANFDPGAVAPGEFAAGFVVELSSDGSSLLRSILIGGSGGDQVFEAELLDSGELIVGGLTKSQDFPVTPDAFQPTVVTTQLNSDNNGFIARLNPDWDQITYATYVSNSRQGYVEGIEIAGETAYWAVCAAFEKDVVFPASVTVEELDPIAGPFLLLLFDQATNELLRAIWAFNHIYEDSFLDSDGGLVLLSESFPDAFFPFLTPGEPFGPPGEATISKLDPLGERWMWSYGFGGSTANPSEINTNVVAGELIGPERLALTGRTLVADIPISPGVVDPNKGPAGRWETWFGEFDVAPEGFERFGVSTDACNGAVRIGVRSLANAGASEFGLSCIGAPRHAPGVLARSPVAALVPIDVGGLAVHLDLGGLFLSPAQADGLGWAAVDLPLTNVPAGLKAYFQFAWVDPGTCGSVGALSASDAIGVEVQP